MEGNEEDWQTMRSYNIQDVVLLEKLYNIIRPWVQSHPNYALYNNDEVEVCPNCGSSHLQKRGFHYTKTMKYQRVRCSDCGTWSRTKSSVLEKEKRKKVLVGVV